MTSVLAQQTSAAEQDAARWLEAEDATMGQVLAWALAQDTAVAPRLAQALGWWWDLRGRPPGAYPLLREITGRAQPGSPGIRCSGSASAPGHSWEDHHVTEDGQGQTLLASIAAPWQAALREGWAAFCAGQSPRRRGDHRPGRGDRRDRPQPAPRPRRPGRAARGDQPGSRGGERVRAAVPGPLPRLHAVSHAGALPAVLGRGDEHRLRPGALPGRRPDVVRRRRNAAQR
jgi:hypothetical protein